MTIMPINIVILEAHKLAKEKGWTDFFALSIMQCSALTCGDRRKADAIEKILQPSRRLKPAIPKRQKITFGLMLSVAAIYVAVSVFS